MIALKDKTKCCGCGACANVCPAKCVTMREDTEGFLYPVIEHEKCVNCGQCEQVCVCMDHSVELSGKVRNAYGAYTLDSNIRSGSSSGGIFFELARRILQNGGCVFGVAMDEDCKGASFCKAETEPELQKLMTSKYLQAFSGDIYQNVERELKTRREVLFSGTPCHINALKYYLRTVSVSDENLICVDVICHGTPSPKVWRQYMREFEQSYHAKMTYISFRCKEQSWRNFGSDLQKSDGIRVFIPHEKDSYMKLFLKNYSLRPSCYACVSKTFRLSDITLGDFWGIEHVLPSLDDAKGTSLVLIRTGKGQQIFTEMQNHLCCEKTVYEDAVRFNSAEYEPVKIPVRRDEFFRNLDMMSVSELAEKYTGLSFYRRIRGKLGTIWKKFTTGGGYEKQVSVWLTDEIYSAIILCSNTKYNCIVICIAKPVYVYATSSYSRFFHRRIIFTFRKFMFLLVWMESETGKERSV